jgi:hypothetical protein
MLSNPEELRASAHRDSDTPAGIAAPVRALWLCEAGRWDAAHHVAQDIETPLGSWIHALLHLIEGDVSNARYWYQRAGKPAASKDQIAAEWERIAAVALHEK